MEDHINRDMAIFSQICEVNELSPEVISAEAQERFPDKFNNGKDAQLLIWTALDHRAKALTSNIDQGIELKGDKVEYTIDGDPAAPSFVVNEENIRSQYSSDIADKVIDALDQVKMPVRS